MTQFPSLQGASIHLVVAWTSGQSYATRQVKMSGEVKDKLKSVAENAADGLIDPTPYAPDADMEDNSHMQAPRDESLDTKLIESLSKGASLDLAKEHELREKNLICHALVATSESKVTLFIRKRSPIQFAKKSLVGTVANGQLAKLKSPLFAFDDRYDAIITDKNVYVLDKKLFEGLFKNSPAILNKTSDWVNEVAGVIPFADGSVDELDSILKRNSVLRNKFLAVKHRSYLSEITPHRLRVEMAKYDLDSAELMHGDKLKVTSQNAKDILRLLNEDLFSGGFSKQQYAASGKRVIT